MKTRIIIYLVFTLLFSRVVAQDSLYFQNPNPQGNDLRSISFFDSNKGWSCGVYGTILYTSDGGTTWIKQNSKTDKHLYAVKALSATTALAGGEGGKIIRTTDGGSTWDSVNTSSTGFIVSFYFYNALSGFALPAFGGTLLKTTDGGITWSSITTSITETANEIAFSTLDPTIGFISCGGLFSSTALYKTTDGGNTWNGVSIPTSYSLNSICMSDTIGWIAGYDGVILKSVNNFSSWIAVEPGSILYKSLYSIDYYNNSIIVAVGEMGEAKRSTDGGNSWTTIMSDIVQWKTNRKIDLLNSTYGFIAGDKGKLMKTTNTAVNWSHCDKGNRTLFWGTCFTDSLHGFAVGDSTTAAGGWTDAKIYGTADGGQTWSKRATIGNATLLGVHFPGPSNGYAVGFNGSRAIYAKTTDGGYNWTSDTAEHFGGKLWSVFFHTPNAGIAVGDSGVALVTSDGGAHWIRKNTGTTQNLFGLYFSYNLPDAPPADTGYIGFAVGQNGTVIKTKDYGESWSPLTTSLTGTINAVHVVPRKAIWLAASSNKIYKSTSNGVFVLQTLPSLSVFPSWTSIYASDENLVHAVGSAGGIVSTNDGGTNWKAYKFTLNNLGGVQVINKRAYIVGEAGTIIATSPDTSSSPQGILHAVQPDSHLGFNFPNPFASATEFIFEVERDGFIHLFITDMQGKVVKEIASGMIRKGEYRQTIDATDLNSGVYFINLDKGRTVESKKMMVVK